MREEDGRALSLSFDPDSDLTWGELARLCSEQLPGQWWVGSSGVTWQCGRETRWLVSRSAVSEIRRARALVCSLTGDFDPPWSSAACARRILKWIGVSQRYAREYDALTDGGVIWHYYHCQPGKLRRAYLWDVEACYYSLLSRLPSPVLFLDSYTGLISFAPLSPAEYDRWTRAMRAIAPVKSVRNSMVGIMYSGSGGSCFMEGKSYVFPKQPGPLKAAASLIVRTAYDLCHEAVTETQAVYAATDCAVTTNNTPPKTWTDLGLRVKLKASGRAELVHLHCYRVGKKETEPYTDLRRSKVDPVTLYTPEMSVDIRPSPHTDWIRRIAA